MVGVAYTGPTRCPICHKHFSNRVPWSHYQKEHSEYCQWYERYKPIYYTAMGLVFVVFAVTALGAYGVIGLGLSNSELASALLASFIPWLASLVPIGLAWHRFHREWLLHHGSEKEGGYRPPRLAIEGFLIAFAGFLLVTVALLLSKEIYSVFMFLGGWVILILGGITTTYGRFHQPTSSGPNFHWGAIALIGGLISAGTLTYMDFIASNDVASSCNQNSSMPVCSLASLGFWGGAVVLFVGLGLGLVSILLRNRRRV